MFRMFLYLGNVVGKLGTGSRGRHINSFRVFVLIILVIIQSLILAVNVPTVPASNSTSWNPKVPCAATLAGVKDILGSSYPSQSVSGSSYQTGSTSGGVPSKRSLSPPCAITNKSGQMISSLVEINSVYLVSLKSEDCSSVYDAVNGGGSYPGGKTYCDATGNIFQIGTTSGFIHVEIDRDWQAAGYCGTGTVCDNYMLAGQVSSGTISLDVQGFVYWDVSHWELHPFTAWKLSSNPQPLSASFSFSPSNPSPGVSVSFTAIASGGVSPYSFSWNFGDGSTGSGGSVTHSYSAQGTYTVSLTVKDSASPTPNTQTVTQSLSVFSPTASGKYNLSWQGFDWDGGREHTLTLNGQFLASLPTSDTTAYANVYTAFSLNITSYVVQGSNTLLFTHANWDCSVGDSVKNLQVASGATVVYSNSTVLPLSCTQSLTYKFTIATLPPPLTNSFTYSPTGPVIGQTVSFNATASGGASPYTFSWSFGDSASDTGGSVLHAYSSRGSYNVTLTTMDSKGQSVLVAKTLVVGPRSSSTSVTCSPTSVIVNQTTFCRATVADASLGTSSSPTGNVAWSSSGAGTFSTPTCTLSSGSCSVTYVPSSSGTETNVITGGYGGDMNHDTSSGTFNLGVTQTQQHPTTTTASCSPSTVVVNQPSSCTATVTDTLSAPTAPTGPLTFTPGGTCTLENPTSNSASCSITITLTSTGSVTVSASYGGDSSHATSTGVTTVTVNPRATSTVITCSPNPVPSSAAADCTATVTDTDVGTASTPSGSVGFVSNSTGTFSATGCTLVSTSTPGVAKCSVSYTPSATGLHRITGTYGGDSTHVGSNGSATETVAPQTAQPYALVISNEGRVYTYQNGTFTPIGQPVTTSLRQVAWKPDGSYALIVGDSGVLLKYDGTRLTTILTQTTSNLYALGWSPDGSYALIGGSGGILFKYDGTLTRLTNPFSIAIRSIGWNPAGDQALLVGSGGGVLIYQTTGQITQIPSGSTNYLYSSAWNPNGRYALIGGVNDTILRYNGTTSSVQAFNVTGLNISPTIVIRAISWSPDGTLALLVGDSGLVLTYNGSVLARLTSPVGSNFYSIGWLGGTAYIAGGSGSSMTYTNGVMAKLANTTATSLRGWAWKPS